MERICFLGCKFIVHALNKDPCQEAAVRFGSLGTVFVIAQCAERSLGFSQYFAVLFCLQDPFPMCSFSLVSPGFSDTIPGAGGVAGTRFGDGGCLPDGYS